MGLFGRKRIGLALGAGGARGLAHIGVLKVLERNNIPIDYIAGTSIGSLVGGLYAVTKDINMIEQLAYSTNFQEMAKAFFDPSLKAGVFKGDRVLSLFDKYITNDTLIQDARIPFVAVSTDIKTAKSYIFKEGNLKTAIRASISIPGLFDPVKYQNMLLIDGASTDPVPTVSLKEKGAQKIVGVNLYSKMFPREIDEKKLSLVSTLYTMLEVNLFELSKRNMEVADVKIDIPTEDVPLTAFAEDPTELIKLGERAAEEQLEKLKRL